MRTVKDEKTLHRLAAARGASVEGANGVFNASKGRFKLREKPAAAPTPPPAPAGDKAALHAVLEAVEQMAARDIRPIVNVQAPAETRKDWVEIEMLPERDHTGMMVRCVIRKLR